MTSIVFMPLQIEYNFQQKKEKERKELKANKKTSYLYSVKGTYLC